MSAPARSLDRRLASGVLMSAALASAGCRAPNTGPGPVRAEQGGAPAAAEAPPPAPPGAGEAPGPLALQDLAPAEILDLRTPWSGDMDPLGSSHRRFIRVAVPVSRTLYF
ncbi:MAG: hypothetical protein ACHQRO_01740, partial [Vicinamibacteria bacterium]